MADSKALTPVTFNLPAQADLGDVADEMEGLVLDFDRIRIPSGGGLAFELPGDEPDNPELVKEIVGVIVDHYPINAYWRDKYAGQNNPPDCSSLDGKVGTGGVLCKTCPNNQFGSGDDGSGKACKNMRRIYILTEHNAFPYLLTLPPTSIRPFSDYLAKRVIGKGLRSYGVVTKITLRKAVSKSGITYSQAAFSLVGVLSPEQTAQMAQQAAKWKQVTRAVAIQNDEYVNGGEKETSVADVPF